MKRLLLAILSLTVFVTTLKAQDKNLVQFSGVIYNVDTNAVVPYVNITNKTTHQSFSANYQGYFSFVAHEKDTVVFSAVGYGKEAVVIPAQVPDKRYTILLKMRMEAINLPVVKVYPWASIDEFNRQFMTMKVADDDLEIAKKNVSRESLASLARTLPMDGQEIQHMNFQNNHIELSNRVINQRGANPLFNPFAWGAFLNQILKGDESRSSD